MGLGRFELPTSRLSGVRSNQLSYRPDFGPAEASCSDTLDWKRCEDGGTPVVVALRRVRRTALVLQRPGETKASSLKHLPGLP